MTAWEDFGLDVALWVVIVAAIIVAAYCLAAWVRDLKDAD